MSASAVARPAPGDYAPYYEAYLRLVSESDVLSVMQAQVEEIGTLLGGPVAERNAGVRHPPYTWTIRQVVGHVTDAERVFGCRALRFARGDRTPLPGFDENDYVREAAFDECPLAELVEEFQQLRRSHVHMLRHLSPTAWQRGGVANGQPITVRALAFIMAGHFRHHAAIVRKRLAGAS